MSHAVAAGVLLLAGCTTTHGVAAITARAPSVDGDRAGGGGLSLDLLQDRWLETVRTETLALPRGHPTYHAWEAAAGPKVIEVRGFRLDAFGGARAQALFEGSPRDRETWFVPFAGVRAEAALRKGFDLRIRGDSAPGNSERDRAWRGSAAMVLGLSTDAALSMGWEMSSIQNDRDRGGRLAPLDANLSGPFLALELRF